MAVVIRNEAYDIIYQDNKPFQSLRISSPQLVEEDIQLSESFGRARMKDISFDGMLFGYGTIDILENIHVEAKDHIATVGLYYTLKGDFDITLNDGEVHRYGRFSNNLVYNPSNTETISLRKKQGIEVIGLNFTTAKFLELAANNSSVLDKYVEGIIKNKPVFQRSNSGMTQRMMQVVQEIQQCTFSGGIKKLFLQSKGLELLALQSEQLEQMTGRTVKATKVSVSDRDRIQYARELLIEHAQEPLSLHELSKRAGINEFKLKNGFKQMFDNTVFGYLNDYRLLQAQQMLQQNISLTAISDELGYSSLQHFSNAFRKKFGVSPMKMRKGF